MKILKLTFVRWPLPVIYITLSLLLHTLAVSFLALYQREALPEPDEQMSSLIQMTFIKKADVSEQLKVQKTPQQIVEQRRDLSYVQDKAPNKAKFLSQYHQKVLKQTASRAGQASQKMPISQQKASSPGSSSKPYPSVSDLMPKTRWEHYMQKTESQKQFTKRETKQNRQISSLGFNIQAGDSSDYLEDIEDGEQTLLNTQAFKFYTYYARIKEQVQPSWESMIEEKVRNILLKGEIFLASQQKTSLLITLDRFGVLVGIQVLKKSQITDFDHIAVESFQMTAPFPHPPKGLMDENGILKIRWDFIIGV